MNIFEAIRADHEIQRELLDKLCSTSGDSKERRSLFAQVKKELKVHEVAEERHFYINLMKEDLTQKETRHGTHEHYLIDKLLEKLTETEFDNTAWLTIAKQLKEQVEHHLHDEEHTLFQMAGKVLTEKEKLALAADYQKSVAAEKKNY